MTIDWTAERIELLGENSKSVLPPKVKLPTLPRALTEFTRKARDPNASIAELSRIVGTDAGLSGDLLRHANSPLFGSKSKITSVQHAISMLGLRTAGHYLTTSGVKHAMKSNASKLIHFESFWNTNIERAMLAREVALLMRADGDVAFTAGMLQDYLLPLVTNQMFDVYVEFAENRDEFPDLPSFETSRLGWGHAEAGAQVLTSWGLPDELVCCVAMHHEGIKLFTDEKFRNTSAAAVAISSLIPDALRQCPNSIDQLLELEQMWPQFQLLSIAQTVDEGFREIASSTTHPFSFLRAVEKALGHEEPTAESGAEGDSQTGPAPTSGSSASVASNTAHAAG